MKCCRCEEEIDLANKKEYEYDYVGEIWCKNCMEIEVKRES